MKCASSYLTDRNLVLPKTRRRENSRSVGGGLLVIGILITNASAPFS